MIDAIPLQTASLASPPSDTPRDKPARILEAAQQFEALLIGKLLEQARESATKGALCGEEDQAGEQAISFANQQMAEALARNGGFGLARMIAAQVSRTGNGPGASGALAGPAVQKVRIPAQRGAAGAD